MQMINHKYTRTHTHTHTHTNKYTHTNHYTGVTIGIYGVDFVTGVSCHAQGGAGKGGPVGCIGAHATGDNG